MHRRNVRFGVVGFGLYPLGLELSVEASYPADEAAATALIFLSGQVQGAILVGLSNAMAQDLSEEASKKEVRDFKQAIPALPYECVRIYSLTIHHSSFAQSLATAMTFSKAKTILTF